MFYYISTNSWNLLESFVSESISPFSFYQVRGYGNNLSRYLDGTNERANYLTKVSHPYKIGLLQI